MILSASWDLHREPHFEAGPAAADLRSPNLECSRSVTVEQEQAERNECPLSVVTRSCACTGRSVWKREGVAGAVGCLALAAGSGSVIIVASSASYAQATASGKGCLCGGLVKRAGS